MFTAKTLGCPTYKTRHGIDYAYTTGGMYHAIASKEMVASMANAGCMSYYGAGGMPIEAVEEAILYLKEHVRGDNYGVNVLFNHIVSAREFSIIDLMLQYEIRNLEAAAFAGVTPELVLFRLAGISQSDAGDVVLRNNIMAKVSRMEIARAFMSPPPEDMVQDLLARGLITDLQAGIAPKIPVANEVCVEAESAGHTDRRNANIVFPSILQIRDGLSGQYGYREKICLGLAGGIGTPRAAAAAFIMGADFILTGSINQCSVEAGAHKSVKAILSQISSEDTGFTPTGDMLESDAQIQVLKKGVLFPVRSKRLHEIYHRFHSVDELPEDERNFILKKVFKKSNFDEVFKEVEIYFPAELVSKAEDHPKLRLGLIIKLYFLLSIKNAYAGNQKEKANFQIHIGQAMGAFNEYVKGTELEHYENRSAPKMAEKILSDTAEYLSTFFQGYMEPQIEKLACAV